MNISTPMLDKIIIGLTAIILLYTFYPKDDSEIKQEVVIDDSGYEDYPLIAWKDTQEKWNGELGDIVKIKYRVFNDDTFNKLINVRLIIEK